MNNRNFTIEEHIIHINKEGNLNLSLDVLSRDLIRVKLEGKPLSPYYGNSGAIKSFLSAFWIGFTYGKLYKN